MFDYAIFIGKFSPIHNGHVAVINHALTKARKVIIVLGQCFEARNTRLPFTEIERFEMIRLATGYDPRVMITYSENYLYNDQNWMASVQDAVAQAIQDDDPNGVGHKIGLAGMNKDSTSYYLHNFPQWRHAIDCGPFLVEYKGRKEPLSSTMIRRKLFEGEIGYLHPYLDEKVLTYLETRPMADPSWERLISDWKYEEKYPATYGEGPHMTVDACVVQSGHVLLIRRGREYGKGLLAMPGGFLNKRETLENGMIRELNEETGLKVPVKVIRGSITARKTYDDPYRSNRAHIISETFKIELEGQANGLPKVKGMDDAMEAVWVPISELSEMRSEFFEDHFSILHDQLGFI